MEHDDKLSISATREAIKIVKEDKKEEELVIVKQLNDDSNSNDSTRANSG